MAQKRIWATSNDGTINYISLTKEYLQGALELLRTSFYQYEPVSIAIGVANDEDAMNELDSFLTDVARIGVSVIAVENKTNIVCGVCFNKIEVVPKEGESTYFSDWAKSCKSSKSKELIKFMDDVDSMSNLFEVCNVDCVYEIMFLSTKFDFTQRGIGLKLCEVSMEMAKTLKINKENVKQSIDGTTLALDPLPQAMTALFSSPYSQKIGRKLNWNIIDKISYDRFYTDEGKPFSSVVDVKYITVEWIEI